MRHSDREPRPSRFGIAGLLCALPLLAAVAAEGPPIRELRIDSQPAGAEVSTIGGSVGYTPLTLSERDIYPNRYPESRGALYGKLVLRRAGCATLEHRVTLDDIEQGLHLRLDCDAQATAVSDQDGYATPRTGHAGAPAAEGASLSERRLRQLQVLQELLDDGLIEAAEEQRIRRRLLVRP